MKFARLAVLITGVSLQGCATLTEGTVQTLSVSTPGVEDATCQVNRAGGGPVPVDGAGLVTVKKANAEITVECRKDGYASGRTVVPPQVSNRAKVELPLGYLIDAATGARYRYPDTVVVEMQLQR